MLENVSANTVYELVSNGGGIIVDIRETDEYVSKHIEGAYLMPLSVIQCLPVKAMLPDTKVFFTCQSGARSRKSRDIFASFHGDAAILDGGINAWEKAGLPLKRMAQTHSVSIGRQVQIAVGILLILAWLGATAGWPVGWIPLLLGLGLTFAGISGFCGLGILLNAMPWNKNKKTSS